MASGKGCRAVFLDRDGVINEVVFRNGKPASPRTLEEFRFCEGLEDALHRLSDAGLRLFIISNQPEIARGLLTPAVLEEITKKILASLPVERVLVCPHDDADDCACRKPKPGIICSVEATDGIDLSKSFLIGDSWKDIQAGQHGGCKTILLKRAYNKNIRADFVTDNLAQAVDLILGEI